MIRHLFLIALLLLQSKTVSLGDWESIAATAQGKVRAAAVLLETGETREMNADSRFPMQSVYKFPIAMAVLHAVDEKIFALDGEILVRKSDLVAQSFRSPLRDRYPQGNVSLPLREILRLAVSESDGTASDVLLRLAGGGEKVTAYLRGLGVDEISVATSETEMAQAQDVQYRNWATPRGAVKLLRVFFQEKGLSASSHALLLQWMTETTTGMHRLKGLLPAAAVVTHKTGTSGTVNGFSAATNDIGVITLPDGRHIAIAVFVSDARADEPTREAAIAQIAKSAWDYWAH